MEGLNDYVSYGIMYDSGLHSREQTSGMLSKWFREYQWCLRQKDTPLMPYRQGMIAAWVMDLEIQRASDQKKSLKNLIAHLLENTPRDQAVSRKEFVAALEALIGPQAEALYARLIESDMAIPLEKYLEDTRYSIADGKILIADG
jgi:predicted metalloprotease with PDZ domain